MDWDELGKCRKQALPPGRAGALPQALPEIGEQQLYVDIAMEIGI